MNNIISWILLSILFFFIPATAMPQPGNTQNNEAVNSIKKQIADLEKQIANDKANNADPRKIKRKEESLVMMKSMLSQIQGAGGNTNTKAAKNISASSKSKYESIITPIILNKPAVVPTTTMVKDKLMGFQGKKLDDSTLITTTGKLIRYSIKENKLVIQPDKKKDPFIKIHTELVKTEERKNEMLVKMNGIKNSFFYYPEILKACKEFDFLSESYANLISNTIELPSIPPAALNATKPAGKTGGPIADNGEDHSDYNSYDYILDYIEEQYLQMMNLLNNPPSTDNFSAPRKKEFDLCFQCDTIGLKKYYKDIEKWHTDFLKYEQELLRKVFSIEHASMIRGMNGSTGNESWDLNIRKAKEFAFKRFKEKSDKLINRYKNDPKLHTPVLQFVLGVERQIQLFGAGDDEVSGISNLPDFNEIFEKYIREEMQRKNYAVALHFSLLLGQERQMQLLGAENKSKSTLFDEAIKFNRFALSIDMNFDVKYKSFEDQKDYNFTANGNLVSYNKTTNSNSIYVSLGQFDCKWQLFLTDENYINPPNAEKLSVPMKILNGVKWYKNNVGEKTLIYSGPGEALMGLPYSSINFCPDGDLDSVLLEPMYYGKEVLATYDKEQMKKSSVETYNIDFLAHANRLILSVPKTKTNKEKLTELAKDIMITSIASNPTGILILDELQKYYYGKKRNMEQKKQLSKLSREEPTIILFDAENLSPVIIDKTIEISNNESKLENISGNIHFKVVHSPVSK